MKFTSTVLTLSALSTLALGTPIKRTPQVVDTDVSATITSDDLSSDIDLSTNPHARGSGVVKRDATTTTSSASWMLSGTAIPENSGSNSTAYFVNGTATEGNFTVGVDGDIDSDGNGGYDVNGTVTIDGMELDVDGDVSSDGYGGYYVDGEISADGYTVDVDGDLSSDGEGGVYFSGGADYGGYDGYAEADIGPENNGTSY